MSMRLTFNRDHASDLAVLSKDKLLDCFKALLDKGLHIAWLLGLRQDLQQLIIGQEEEPAQAQRSDCAKRLIIIVVLTIIIIIIIQTLSISG
jgi:hypothetical protein